MNRKRLVVILEDQIYLYDISNMKLLYTIETSPNPNGETFPPTSSFSCHSLNSHSHLCSLPLLGKLLPRLPPPSKSGPLLLRPTLTRPSRKHAYSPHKRRRPHLRHHKKRSHQRGRSPPVPPLLHHHQRRRHPPGDRLGQGHHHPRLLRARGPQALPIPAGVDAQPDLQHVLQRHLHFTLRLLRHRHRARLQAYRPEILAIGLQPQQQRQQQ